MKSSETMSGAVAEKVVSAIARMKKIPPETITLESRLEDLKIDSLDGLTLFFELEDALGMPIPDDRARALRTVGQVVQEIDHLLAEKSASEARPLEQVK